MSAPQKQRGVALLIVLMIVALVAILATEMGQRMQLQIQRTMNIKDAQQAYWYAMGAEAFARKSIKQIIEQADGVIALDQPWAQAFTFPIENGVIQAQLEDAQSCFNLNALAATTNAPSGNAAPGVSPEMTAFETMLMESELEIDNYTVETVRNSIADWLDEDSIMRAPGAEDSEYESRQPPYLAANGPMVSQSELRLINGVSPVWLRDILPLVCVLPDNSSLKLNVNTISEASAAVLAGATGLSKRDAEALIGRRQPGGWDDINSFLAEPSIQALSLDSVRQGWFSVNTEYFMLHAKTQYNNATFTMSTLFKVNGNGRVSVLRREFREVE